MFQGHNNITYIYYFKYIKTEEISNNYYIKKNPVKYAVMLQLSSWFLVFIVTINH